jgi:hypothetical protein
MENPATWGALEHAVDAALDRAEASHATGVIGLSRTRQVADAVRQWLAEHGDTQQVREEIRSAIHDAPDLVGHRVGPDHDPAFALHGRGEIADISTDAVMAVVARIVAARDAAVEQAKKAKQWLIDAAGADVTDLLQSLDECTARAERAERDLAAARQQLDLVRAAVNGWPTPSESLAQYREAVLRLFDAPARPAGHDESGIRAYIEGDDDLRRKFGGEFFDDAPART